MVSLIPVGGRQLRHVGDLRRLTLSSQLHVVSASRRIGVLNTPLNLHSVGLEVLLKTPAVRLLQQPLHQCMRPLSSHRPHRFQAARQCRSPAPFCPLSLSPSTCPYRPPFSNFSGMAIPGSDTTDIQGSISVHPDHKYNGAYWLRISIPRPISSNLKCHSKTSQYIDVAPTDPQAPSTLQSSSPALSPSKKETCIFFISPTETISDVLAHLREEYPELGVPQAVKGDRSCVDQPDQMSLDEFVKGSYHIQIGPRIHLMVDKREMRSQLKETEVRLTKMRAELMGLDEMMSTIEKGVNKRVAFLKYAGLTYVCGQLGTIVFLTQQLGWDLMEPVSYLVTVATMIFSAVLYVSMRREPDYSNIASWLRTTFRRRLMRRKGFDEQKYEKLRKEVDGRTSWAGRMGRLI
ncbi:uncharacterized protein SPPG_06886 [Spizellomyces punctatus DAOM BR117]|uniref:Calcium uniporter protein, mitochondrial n=1 Tax=Spizellomyces punctatus (strain DAOM BR117) TaxID=645134 RepID=A0A0L0H8N7_SPIPD|nr:uncharacterized protein SPPG_06886 [Spizellomyces punctatus DAOM BR117]KNC97895.1 hypothetical protein SPPG_06886 [Spizellomyces punctatus DAOM BR117]|eukprot:XP_016605935.1 hypothetical protein SPPG_06886 [Spizellomyces punctatus DAOM BR117]